MSTRPVEPGDRALTCPNCARDVPMPAFSRWPPDNALATAVCRGCGRKITVTLRRLRALAA